MTKMTKVQRGAILASHASAGRESFDVSRESTLDAMVANGWAVRVATVSGYPTTAGLVGAGVDMDATHADAKIDHVIWTAQHTPIQVVEMFEVPRCFWIAECPDEAETVLCTDEDLADWLRRNGPENSTVWTWAGPRKVQVRLETLMVSAEPDGQAKYYETRIFLGGIGLTRISWDV